MDEYTLAAFLAGTLPEDRRHEVLAFLSENADARELLCMAHEALEAAQQPVVEPFKMPPPALPPTPPRSADRLAASPADTPSPQRRWRTRGFAATSLGLLVTTILSLSVYLALQDVDRTRSGSDDIETLTIHVSPQPLEFRWDETPDAYQYHLVIWDVEAVEIVEQYNTQSTHLAPEDPFMQSLVPHLKAGRTYSVSVNAVNRENRTFAYSERLEFRWQE